MSIKPYRGIRALLDNVDDSLGNLADQRDELRHEKAELVAEMARLDARLRQIHIQEALVNSLAIGQQQTRTNILITHQKVAEEA